MAKPKNHYIRSKDQKDLERLAEEYEMLGRDVSLTEGTLVVYALPKKRARKVKIVREKGGRSGDR